MPARNILGAQWGAEGKGKFGELLTGEAEPRAMAVGDSVVCGQACAHDGAREDLPLRDPGPRDERAEPDDRDLGREDDAEDALDAALTDARDGDRRL